MFLSVVILSKTDSKNLHAMTLKAIESLQESEDFENKHRLEIILIESNKEYVKDFPYPENVTVIVPRETFGFHRFLNIGIRKSKGDFIALCNNDLIFHPNWFSEIINVFNAHKGILSFSPIDPGKELQKYTGNFEIGYKVTQHIKGWCLVCHKSLFPVIKELDERFQFYYSDNDYALSLIYYGIKHAVVTASHVAHLQKITSEDASEKEDTFFTPEEQGISIPKYLYHEDYKSLLANKRGLYDHLIYYRKWGKHNSMYRIADYSVKLNNMGLNSITRLLMNIKKVCKI